MPVEGSFSNLANTDVPTNAKITNLWYLLYTYDIIRYRSLLAVNLMWM